MSYKWTYRDEPEPPSMFSEAQWKDICLTMVWAGIVFSALEVMLG
jgi:hypothetical protein